MNTPRPSLAQFERQVAARDCANAFQTLLHLLQAIDDRYGRLENVDIGQLNTNGSDEEIALVLCTRVTAALGRLLTDQQLSVTAVDFERLLLHHRWVDLMFSISGFRTSDHLFPLLVTGGQGNQMRFDGPNFLRLLCLMSMNTTLIIDFEQFWRAQPVASALAFLQYISSRYVFSPRAFDFRERLLEWIPDKLDEVKLGSLILSRLPEIYMHCSYAITPKKHLIKTGLMKQMRRACLEAGCTEVEATMPETIPDKPTVVVVAEHFLPGHAVHRTHSRAIASLRERFHVVGAIYPDPAKTPIADFFDECIPMPPKDFMSMVRYLADEIKARKPVLIFYLGVGMVPQVIGLASLRLAPIQCVSFGHTATTMSEAMDYFILPEDFVKDEATFSEKVLALPKAAMPFAPRAFTPMERPASDGTIRVAIPASTMKLNPRLFEAVGKIAGGAKSKMEIQFFPLAGTGIPYVDLCRAVKSWIPGAKVFAEAPHDVYMERLSRCDLFLCPFPYGNMNSIIDSFRLGMPGVCLDGAESHAHADVAFFARIGLPAELAAQTTDQYVAAAVKLIDDKKWRTKCQKIVAEADLEAAFFSGDASLFCNAIADLIWPNGKVKTKAKVKHA
jgi:hypothetical protein